MILKELAANWGASVIWPALKSVLLDIECQAIQTDITVKPKSVNIFILTDGDIAHENQALQVLKTTFFEVITLANSAALCQKR